MIDIQIYGKLIIVELIKLPHRQIVVKFRKVIDRKQVFAHSICVRSEASYPRLIKPNNLCFYVAKKLKKF
jgi:hypothetical protein